MEKKDRIRDEGLFPGFPVFDRNPQVQPVGFAAFIFRLALIQDVECLACPNLPDHPVGRSLQVCRRRHADVDLPTRIMDFRSCGRDFFRKFLAVRVLELPRFGALHQNLVQGVVGPFRFFQQVYGFVLPDIGQVFRLVFLGSVKESRQPGQDQARAITRKNAPALPPFFFFSFISCPFPGLRAPPSYLRG